MNILVTGANGQLGNEMRIVSKDTNDSYTFTDWCIPTEHAILSEKDTKHPLLKDFESPFIYK